MCTPKDVKIIIIIKTTELTAGVCKTGSKLEQQKESRKTETRSQKITLCTKGRKKKEKKGGMFKVSTVEHTSSHEQTPAIECVEKEKKKYCHLLCTKVLVKAFLNQRFAKGAN